MIAMARRSVFGWWRELDGGNIATSIVISIYFNDSLRRTVGKSFVIPSVTMTIILAGFQQRRIVVPLYGVLVAIERGIRSIVGVNAVLRGQKLDGFPGGRCMSLLSWREDTTSGYLLERSHGILTTRTRADGVKGFRKQGVGNLVVLLLLLLARRRGRRAIGGSVCLFVDVTTVLVLVIYRASLRPLFGAMRERKKHKPQIM